MRCAVAARRCWRIRAGRARSRRAAGRAHRHAVAADAWRVHRRVRAGGRRGLARGAALRAATPATPRCTSAPQRVATTRIVSVGGRGHRVGVVLARAGRRQRPHRPRARDAAACRTRCTSRSPATSGGGRCATTTPIASKRVHHGQRDPHPGRPAGDRSTLQRQRRDPQLLGAELHGKRDLIPGRDDDARRCAPTRPASTAASAPSSAATSTRCMALLVVAEPPDDFAALGGRSSAQPAAEPATRSAERGPRGLRPTCVMCHAVQGTRAERASAPDLTHVASRAHASAPARSTTRRPTARLDHRPAAHQAGRPHAAA